MGRETNTVTLIVLGAELFSSGDTGYNIKPKSTKIQSGWPGGFVVWSLAINADNLSSTLGPKEGLSFALHKPVCTHKKINKIFNLNSLLKLGAGKMSQ